MLKRVRRELQIWNREDGCTVHFDDITLVLTATFRSHDITVHIPESYPFSPPRHRHAFLLSPLHARTWALSVLSFPPSLQVIETPFIPCTCCHSPTCPNNWAVSRKVWEIVYEAIFLTLYRQLDSIVMFELPDDLWIKITSFL